MQNQQLHGAESDVHVHTVRGLRTTLLACFLRWLEIIASTLACKAKFRSVHTQHIFRFCVSLQLDTIKSSALSLLMRALKLLMKVGMVAPMPRFSAEVRTDKTSRRTAKQLAGRRSKFLVRRRNVTLNPLHLLVQMFD
jgi:hypothetical protein